MRSFWRWFTVATIVTVMYTAGNPIGARNLSQEMAQAFCVVAAHGCGD